MSEFLYNIFAFVMSLGVPLFLGWELLKLFFYSKNGFCFLERFFFSFGLGIGVITLLLLILSLLKVHFNVYLIGVLCVIISAGLRKYGSWRAVSVKSCGAGGVRYTDAVFSRALWVVLCLFIAWNLLSVFFRTMLMTIDMWDSWAIWAFKAKIFFVHKIVPLEMFQQFKTVWGNWDYPLHVPLMEAWVLLWSGQGNDFLTRGIFPLFFGGLCAVAFSFLRRNISLTGALLGACFLASLPNLQIYTVATIAESVLLFYYLSSFALLFRWAQEDDGRLLVLSAVFAALAFWTKVDAGALVASNVLFLMYTLFKRQHLNGPGWKNVVVYIAVVVAINAPWSLYKMMAGIENVIFNGNYFQFEKLPLYLERGVRVFDVLEWHFSNFLRWNMLWPMFFTAVLFNVLFYKSKAVSGILAVILFQWMIYVLMYITIPRNDFVSDAMCRLLLAPGLLAILYFMLVMFEKRTLAPHGKT